MLYKELAFVSVVTRLFSPNHAQSGVSYTITGSTATCISGVDTCTISSDVKAIDVINCNDANQCIINCDEKKGLEDGHIYVQDSPNFTLNVSGDECMKNAVVDVSTASNARIVIQSAVKNGLKTAKIDAQNAQFLLIDVMSGSSFGWPQVDCPRNSVYSGPEYDAPCVMNNSEGGGSDVGIYVPGGYPKDFQYLPTPSVDSDAFSSLQLYMSCASDDVDDSNEGLGLNWLSWTSYSSFETIIEDGSSNACYATKDPTSATTLQPTTTPTKVPTKTPTNTPTRSPTKTPSKAPTKLPTSTPSSAPTKLPTTSPTKRPTKSPVPPLTARPATTTSTTASATRATTGSLSTTNPNANEHRVDDQSATTSDAAHHSQTNDTTLASQSHWKLIAITLSCLFCCIFSFMLCGCYWLFSKRKSMAKFQRDEPQADFNYFAMPGAGAGADSAIVNVSGLRYVQLADVSSSLQFADPVPLQTSVNALPSSQSAHLRTGEVSFEQLIGSVVPGAFETTANVKMGELDVDMDEEDEELSSMPMRAANGHGGGHDDEDIVQQVNRSTITLDESVFGGASVAKQESVTAGGDGGGGGASVMGHGKLTVDGAELDMDVDLIRLSTVTTITQVDEDDIPPQTPVDNAFGGQIGDEDMLQIENASDDDNGDDDDDASENDMETMG